MALLLGSNIEGINVWSWLQWGFDHEINATNSTYEYATPGGNTVILTGFDFAYENGIAADGIIETLTILGPGGDQIASITLGDVSLEEAMANNLHNFWDVLLAGSDQIVLGSQDDTVSGYAGSDQIDGGAGNDNIDGGADNDWLNGGLGNDFVDGGAGDDEIIFNAESGNDIIYGGLGSDTVIHNGLTSEWPDIIQIEKVVAPYVGYVLDEPFVFSGNLKSENHGQKLTTKQSDFDLPYERDGQTPQRQEFQSKSIQTDRSVGEPDHKILSDGLFNGPANFKSAFEDFDVSLKVGSTTGSGNPDEPERTEATLRSVEDLEIYGGVGGGSLSVGDLSNTALENGRIIFDGGAGEDNLNALGTGTAITYIWRFTDGVSDPGDANVNFGSSTDDVLHLIDQEDAGLNIKIGATGSGVKIDEGITPGIGPSDLFIRNVESIDLDFGDGDDSVVVYEDISGVYGSALEIDFGEGTGDLDSTAHTGRVEVHGGDGQNAFFAGGGDDLLIGGATHDDIFGGAGDDEIFGEGGADDIGGGEGNDTIAGGEGGDRFFFGINEGTDTILDFVAGDLANDRLDFIDMGLTEADLSIFQMGDHTHITTTLGTSVILENVLATDLNSNDFLTL